MIGQDVLHYRILEKFRGGGMVSCTKHKTPASTVSSPSSFSPKMLRTILKVWVDSSGRLGRALPQIIQTSARSTISVKKTGRPLSRWSFSKVQRSENTWLAGRSILI